MPYRALIHLLCFIVPCALTAGGEVPDLSWSWKAGKKHTVPAQVTDLGAGTLPKNNFSVEVLARIDKPLRWGGLAGFFQDNGGFEKGWLAGYNTTHLYFALSTGKRLTYLTSTTSYQKGKWYHLVGTFDGREMKIYVNGRQEALSRDQSGAVDYPGNTTFTVGSYRDADENFPHTGAIRYVKLYRNVLSGGIVQSISEQYSGLLHPEQPFAFGPYLRFTSHSRAVVECTTKRPCTATLSYGTVPEHIRRTPSVVIDDAYAEGLSRTVTAKEKKRAHRFILKGLEYRRMYAYRIQTEGRGKKVSSPVYAFDNALNYFLPGPSPSVKPSGGQESSASRLAVSLLKAAQCTRGFCLVLGIREPELLVALAARSRLFTVGVDTSNDTVRDLRSILHKKGVYGKRIKVRAVSSYDRLPFPSNFANLVVADMNITEKKQFLKELLRILRPSGGTCFLRPGSSGASVKSCIKNVTASLDGARELSLATIMLQKMPFIKITRSSVENGGSWTHQYGDAGNSANSGGSLSGATSTSELQVQWLGSPEGNFGLDRNPRMPPPLAVDGRLFHQGMNRMAALDSYNGALLWSAEIPDLRRVNMPHDTSNWCADDASLFVAVKDRLWVMEQLTGAVETTVKVPLNHERYEYDWGYIAQADGMFYGSAVPKASAYTAFRGKTSWFDGTSGAGTYKIVSSELYGFKKGAQHPVWTWSGGRIINSTIAVAGDCLFAAGSDAPSVKQHASGRIASPGLWKNMFLLCLDRKTGAVHWKKPIKTVPGVVVYFLQCADDVVIIASSASGKYHLYAYAQTDGHLLWHAEHPWTGDNHSGHMQHPVLVGNTVFLEPCGYDIETGRRTTDKMGRHEGCATYCGTREALIYRGHDRRISMWDVKTEEVTSWINLRPSCWLSTVSADGMILAPEGGGGCSCGKWLETSVVFSPRSRKRAQIQKKESGN